jgi:hypothetical protein
VGVTIATPSVSVTLRGLVINGVGGTHGVQMTDGSKLSIENCVISNFATGTSTGVVVSTPAKVRVVDSVVRDNNDGLRFTGGASADVMRSTITGNSLFALMADGSVAASTTTVAVSDSIVSGNGFGVISRSLDFSDAHTRVSVMRSTVSNNATTAIVANSTGTATATMVVSGSLVFGNGFGLIQSGTGVLESTGDNTVRTNATQVQGTITPVPPM